MAGGDLVGAEGGHHEHVRAVAVRPARLPAAEQGDGQAVGPLAVVEDHEGGPVGSAERVEQGGQRVEAAGLPVLLGAELRLVGRAQRHGQPRKGGGGGGRPDAEPAAQVGGRRRAGLGRGGDDAVHDAVEHLERALRPPGPPPGL